MKYHNQQTSYWIINAFENRTDRNNIKRKKKNHQRTAAQHLTRAHINVSGYLVINSNLESFLKFIK